MRKVFIKKVNLSYWLASGPYHRRHKNNLMLIKADSYFESLNLRGLWILNLHPLGAHKMMITRVKR